MKKPAAVDSTTEEGSQTNEPVPSPLKRLRVGQALFETTWRIVIPVVLWTGIGIFADIKLGTKPWLTLLGTLIGFVLAGMLIARLLKESENE